MKRYMKPSNLKRVNKSLTDEERMQLRLGIIPEGLSSYVVHTPREALQELGRKNRERAHREISKLQVDEQAKATEKSEPTTRRETFFKEYGIEPIVLPERDERFLY